MIVSLADPDAPDVKAYLLKDLRIADVALDALLATAVPTSAAPTAVGAVARTRAAVAVAVAAAAS